MALELMTNNQLLKRVVESSWDKEAANLLRERWIDFWQKIKSKHGNGAFSLEEDDTLMAYHERAQALRKEIPRLAEVLDGLNRQLDLLEGKVKRERRRLKRVTASRLHRLENKVKAEKCKTTVQRKKVQRLEEILARKQRWIDAVKFDRVSREEVHREVMRKMVEENLTSIDRHLHGLALREAFKQEGAVHA